MYRDPFYFTSTFNLINKEVGNHFLMRGLCCEVHYLNIDGKKGKVLTMLFSCSNVCNPGDGEMRVTRELIVIYRVWWTHLEAMSNNKAY